MLELDNQLGNLQRLMVQIDSYLKKQKKCCDKSSTKINKI